MPAGLRVLVTACLFAVTTFQPLLSQVQNAAAQDTSSQTSGREKMRGLLTELADHSGDQGTSTVQLNTAFANIDELDRLQPLALEQLFAQNPGWERIPSVLEANRNADAEREQLRARYGVAGIEPESGSPESLEQFRADFLFFLHQLAQVESIFNPLEGGRSTQLATLFETMDHERLEIFRQAYIVRMMELANSRPDLKTGGADQTSELITKAAFNCPDFGCEFTIRIPNSCADLLVGKVCVNDIISLNVTLDICDAINLDELLTAVCSTAQGLANEVNSLLNQITNFVNTTTSQITGAFNDIANFTNSIPGRVEDLANLIYDTIEQALADLIALVPKTFDDFIQLLADAGLDITSAGWWEDVPRNLTNGICPPVGTVIPVVGTVGTPAAEFKCKGINAVTGKLFDYIPSTASSFAFKVAGAVVYFPIQYLCECTAKRAQEIYYNDTFDFQDLLASKVDLNLSTRASEADLNLLRGLLTQGGATIVATATNLDAIKLNAGVLEDAITDQRSFIAIMDQELKELDFSQRLLDSDSDPALLAVPAAQGGLLEQVRDTVVNTIQALQAANEPVNQASSFLNKGNSDYNKGRFDKAFENYKKAYIEATK